MIDHFCAKGPKFWWMVMNGISHVLDHKISPKLKGFALNSMHMLIAL
jgi:hypothetical protein